MEPTDWTKVVRETEMETVSLDKGTVDVFRTIFEAYKEEEEAGLTLGLFISRILDITCQDQFGDVFEVFEEFRA